MIQQCHSPRFLHFLPFASCRARYSFRDRLCDRTVIALRSSVARTAVWSLGDAAQALTQSCRAAAVPTRVRCALHPLTPLCVACSRPSCAFCTHYAALALSPHSHTHTAHSPEDERTDHDAVGRRRRADAAGSATKRQQQRSTHRRAKESAETAGEQAVRSNLGRKRRARRTGQDSRATARRRGARGRWHGCR